MLRVASGSYAHLHALMREGEVRIGDRALGLDWSVVRPGAIFRHAFDDVFPYDVAEMSLSTVYVLADRGDPRFVTLPVFPSRMFRHGAIYVRGDWAPGRDLAGARIGTVRLSQTATVWIVELLARHLGLERGALSWHVAEPPPVHPEGLDMQVIGGSLADLQGKLLARELDMLISVQVPPGLADGRVRRALPDFRELERAALAAGAYVPPMHTVVLRRAVVEAEPELPEVLVAAMERSRRAALEWLADEDASALPLPLQHAWVGEALGSGGPDPWPAGIEANREALDDFARLLHRQGFTSRVLAPEAVFHHRA